MFMLCVQCCPCDGFCALLPVRCALSVPPLQGHSKWVTSVAWEPAHRALPARRFVSGSQDKTLRVWDAVSEPTCYALPQHTQT